LGAHIKAVRDDVKGGSLLSEAFRRQNVFPTIYTTSVMAGEKSGSLVEVLERYIGYQKLSLAVRKKVMVSLLYPLLLVGAAIALIVFLVVFVVPNFAELYKSMSADLPVITQVLIAVGTTARSYVLVGVAALIAAGFLFRMWSRSDSAKETLDNIKLRAPLFGDMWIKYQVAQFSRVLGTLLVGGIPLMQALETAANSLGTPVHSYTSARPSMKTLCSGRAQMR
jgi:type IV pilus assembly protein PilC